MSHTSKTMFAAASALLLAACSGMSPRQQEYSTGGAVVGGVAGALIDHKNPWRGAMIGTVGGWLLGNALATNEDQRSAAAGSLPPPAPSSRRTDPAKFCPECGREYPGEANFCPVDGSQLRVRQF
jgi:hypothetical protein